MRMRRIVGVSAAAVVCVGLTACGGDDASAPSSTTAVATTLPAATEPPATEPPATEAPATEPPVTEPRSTEPPMTEPPVTEPPVTEPPTPPVFAFPDADAVQGWSVINDTVMGGVSSGQLAWVDDALVFTGELSLENNGGFASVRSPGLDLARVADWATRAGPRLVVQGDGRTWTVEVRTDEGDGGWITTIATSADAPTDVEPAWTSFEPVTRFLEPRATDTPLDPARIVSIAFYLVDGIEGPFTLTLRSIT